jgi:alcohol dehydrogenase (cytochrome c)
MANHKNVFVLTLIAATVALVTGTLTAQQLDSATLLHPPADSWPQYHGTYNGQRHSALTQIIPQNVGSLTLAWAFQTNTPQARDISSSPILVNGVLYFSMVDNVWAVDARSGRQIWHYTYPDTGRGLPLGNRGVAMYRDWIFFQTKDGHLVSLNAKDGSVRWKTEIADSRKGYWTTAAPLVVKNHLLVGVSTDFDNLPGYLRSVDPETGDIQWQWNAAPGRGTASPEGWGGGSPWLPGTYDPDLNLIYWGTGDPNPVLNGAARPGDNLYTCSIVALNPDTGKLVWAFQVSPHDTHDWDAVEVPVLVDASFRGKPTKMLMQASRNGYFFVLDRTTGKNLLTAPFTYVNWTLGVDDQGRPIPNPEKEPKPDGVLIAPDEHGGTNFRSPSVDPKRGLFVVSASEGFGLYFHNSKEHGDYGWAGEDFDIWGKPYLAAIDYQTGKIRWRQELAGSLWGGGVLTTASGLTITGDSSGNVLALDTTNGKILWHSSTGGHVQSSPISYELDGRQYIVTSSGSVVFAWTLPMSASSTQGLSANRPRD